MKNIKTKIWTFLGTAIMLLPFVLGLGTAEVSAAVSPTPENVTVNLHKLKFTSAPENQINNGTELTFPNSEPLNGVEFTYMTSLLRTIQVKTQQFQQTLHPSQV